MRPSPSPDPSLTFLLVGNYDVGNAGDDILKEYFLERFPEVEWQIVSAHPSSGELPRFPGGLRSLLSFRWFCTFRALQKAKGMIFGGGSLFTDSESLSACFIWGAHAWFSFILGKPFLLAFQGIGPFRTRVGERVARWVFKRASFISVRDSASFQRATLMLSSTESRVQQCTLHRETSGEEQVCIMNTKVIQSMDPAFLLLKEKKSEISTKNMFIFIPRFSSVWNGETKQKFLSFFEDIQASGGTVRILSLAPGDMREYLLCESFAKPLHVTVEKIASLREVSSLLLGATCVLTERFHGALASLAAEVPFLALRKEDGDKLHSIASMCGCPSETLASFTEEGFRGVDWEKRKESLQKIQEHCKKLAEVGEEELRKAIHDRL